MFLVTYNLINTKSLHVETTVIKLFRNYFQYYSEWKIILNSSYIDNLKQNKSKDGV